MKTKSRKKKTRRGPPPGWQKLHAAIRRWQRSPESPLPQELHSVDDTNEIHLNGGYIPIYSRDRRMVLIFGHWVETRWIIDSYKTEQSLTVQKLAPETRDALKPNTVAPHDEQTEFLIAINEPVQTNQTEPTLEQLIAASPQIALEDIDYSEFSSAEIGKTIRECRQWPPPLGLSRAAYHYAQDSGFIDHTPLRGTTISRRRIRANYSSSIPITQYKSQILARWIWYLRTGRWLDRRIVVTQIDDKDPYDLRFSNLQLQRRKGSKSKNDSSSRRTRARECLRTAKAKFEIWEAKLKLWSSDYYLSASGHYREPPCQIYREVYRYCPVTHDLICRRLDRSWFATDRDHNQYNQSVCDSSAIVESASGCKTVMFAGREIFADRIVFSLNMETDLGDDAIIHLDGVASNIAFENLWRQTCINLTGTVLTRRLDSPAVGYKIVEQSQRDQAEPKYRVFRKGQHIGGANDLDAIKRMCERDEWASLGRLPCKYFDVPVGYNVARRSHP